MLTKVRFHCINHRILHNLLCMYTILCIVFWFCCTHNKIDINWVGISMNCNKPHKHRFCIVFCCTCLGWALESEQFCIHSLFGRIPLQTITGYKHLSWIYVAESQNPNWTLDCGIAGKESCGPIQTSRVPGFLARNPSFLAPANLHNLGIWYSGICLPYIEN